MNDEQTCDLCGAEYCDDPCCSCEVAATRMGRVVRGARARARAQIVDVQASQDMGFHFGEARRIRAKGHIGVRREMLAIIHGTIDRPARIVGALKIH